MSPVICPASFAGEIRERRGLDAHAGFAGDDGEGTASLHHRHHLRPIGRVGLCLESMARLDGKPGLLTGLGEEDDRGRVSILGEVNRDIGIRIRSEHPVGIAIDPHLAIRRLEGQSAQAALDGIRPGVERHRGRDRDEQKSRSKNRGRELHRGEGLFLGVTLHGGTTYERITYVLRIPVSTIGATEIAGRSRHDQ